MKTVLVFVVAVLSASSVWSNPMYIPRSLSSLYPNTAHFSRFNNAFGRDTADPFEDNVFQYLNNNNYINQKSSMNPFEDFERSMALMREQSNKLLNDFKNINNELSVLKNTNFDPTNAQNKDVTETKVVDGKEYKVHETVYSDGDKNNGQVVHYHSVVITPTSGAGSENIKPGKVAKKDVEVFTPKTNDDELPNENSLEPDIPNEVEYVDNVDIVQNPRSIPIDLSKDTLVNNLITENQEVSGLRMIDPDAELIDVEPVNNNNQIRSYNDHHENINKFYYKSSNE